jgi:glutathione S-transferase
MARELYFISGSPPCWSVMLALEVKGLAYTPRRLDNAKREQKSPEYLAINPRGQVPVLVEDDVTVCETLAVLSYLEAVEPTPSLFGSSPIETAKIWQSICDYDGNLREPVGKISRPLFRGKAVDAADQIKDAAETVRDELALYETALNKNEWIASDALSAADLIAFPVIMQLLRAAGREDAEPLQLAIHPLADHFPNLASWISRIEALPGYDNAYPPHWK